MVDADGDGVPDARWTWAAAGAVGNKLYISAVRIIDNSSLINLSTATAVMSGSATAGGDPLCNAPSDLDVSRLLSRWDGPDPSGWSALTAGLFAYRGVSF